MSVNVNTDTILDAIVGRLSTQLVPVIGQSITPLRPVHSVQRYVGSELTVVEGLERGIAGRSPAMRVRFAGRKKIRGTIGRRRARVTSRFSVVVATDCQRGKDDRDVIHSLAESVERLVGGRTLGLQMSPLQFEETSPLRDEDKLFALAVVFTTNHWSDQTEYSGSDLLLDAQGDIVQGGIVVAVATQGTAGATRWDYVVVGIDDTGARVVSGGNTTLTGAAVLSGANFNRLTWAAIDGCVSYKVLRTSANGTPASTGLIATTALLTLDDTGLAAAASPAPYSQPVEVDLS